MLARVLRSIAVDANRTLERIVARCEKLVGFKCWDLVAALVICVLILITATPAYEYFNPNDPARWDLKALEWKSHHPLEVIKAEDFNPNPQPGEEGTFTHLEKRTFRITIPLVAYFLNLGLWGQVILQHIASVLFIWLTIRLAFRLSGDRVIALLQGIAFGFMFVGTWGFHDFFLYNDGIAYLLMLLAMYSASAPVLFIVVLLASFTDERAFINAPLLIAYWCLVPRLVKSPKGGSQIETHWRQVVAVAGGMLAYLVVRFSLAARLGLKAGTADVFNPLIVKFNMLTLPISLPLLWESYWIIAIAGLVILATTGRRRWALGLGCFAAISILIAVSVIDFTRSAAYAFPMLWICFSAVLSTESTVTVRKLLLVVAAINVVFPTHHMMFGIKPFLPIVRLLFH